MTLRADDRVLLLDIPGDQELATIARVLIRGVLVAIGSREAVDQARAALADFDNVMLIQATPLQIPWRDSFFTRVLVPDHMRQIARIAQAEIARVLAPEGQIEISSSDA